MWVIITRNQCIFCDEAKALLKSKNHQYTEYNVQSQSSKWVLTLIKQAGMTTVPQVFAPDGAYVGGYNDLEKELLKGETL